MQSVLIVYEEHHKLFLTSFLTKFQLTQNLNLLFLIDFVQPYVS